MFTEVSEGLSKFVRFFKSVVNPDVVFDLVSNEEALEIFR